MKVLSTICILILSVTQAIAQQQLPIPRNLQKVYDNNTRSLSGKPGKNYWQNTADYNLDIVFNPSTRSIDGKADIVYTNNSPDTLREIVFKLYPNLYQKGNMRQRSIEPQDVTDGIQISGIAVNGAPTDISKLKINGTNASIRIAALAKGTISFSIKYQYTLNKDSHIRTGQIDDGAFFVAYFFPRIAVYDDAHGWNKLPYNGSEEFYNDFCNFKLNLSIPDNYEAWATGDLVNCEEVFTPKYCSRIAAAEKSDELVYVIDSADLKEKNITKPNPINTWKFVAKNVTDVAFAISSHYLWQSSSLVVDKSTGRRTRVDAVFNAEHKDYFLVGGDANKTVYYMSYRFPKWPYPYNHITVFDGLDQMEYPMMVNDNPVEDRAESIELTDHEIFHTMFPFYMGTNETRYAWMDEGWATIGEWLISPMIDSTLVDEYGMPATERFMGSEEDMPIATTLTTNTTANAAFINAYPKPALGYLYVKDMLGDDLFFKGLHNYIRNWNGKHPLPLDFFYSMNEGTGKNLNWFWQKWFYENGVADLAIKSFVQTGSKKILVVESKGTKPVPIDAVVTYTDGTTEKLHRSIAVWEKGVKLCNINFTSPKKVNKMKLEHVYTPDINRENNIWMAK